MTTDNLPLATPAELALIAIELAKSNKVDDDVIEEAMDLLVQCRRRLQIIAFSSANLSNHQVATPFNESRIYRAWLARHCSFAGADKIKIGRCNPDGSYTLRHVIGWVIGKMDNARIAETHEAMLTAGKIDLPLSFRFVPAGHPSQDQWFWSIAKLVSDFVHIPLKLKKSKKHLTGRTTEDSGK